MKAILNHSIKKTNGYFPALPVRGYCQLSVTVMMLMSVTNTSFAQNESQSTNITTHKTSNTNALSTQPPPTEQKKDISPINNTDNDADFVIPAYEEKTTHPITQKDNSVQRDNTPNELATTNTLNDEPQNKNDSINSQKDQQSEANYFERLYQKYFGNDIVAGAKKINVIVNIVDPALTENVQSALSEVREDEFSDYDNALPRMRKIAKNAASAVGFYDASFVFKKINAQVLKVTITPNQPVRIAQTDIRLVNQTDPSLSADLQHLIDSFERLNVGNTFNHAHYDQLKLALTNKAKQLGFFDAKWQTAKATVRLPENTANIKLVYELGQRYKFGHLYYVNEQGQDYYTKQVLSDSIVANGNVNAPKNTNVKSNDYIRVNKKILDQLVPFTSEQYYDQNKLTNLTNRLLETQYFSNIDIVPQLPKTNNNNATEKSQSRSQPDNSEQHIPIMIKLNNSKPNSAELGIGYGTSTGVRLRGKLTRNLFNKRGHSTTLNVEAAKARQALEISYKLPYKHPVDDTLTAFSGYEHERRDSGVGTNIDFNKLTLGLQRDFIVGRYNHALSLVYFLDEVDANNTNISQITDLPAQFQAGNQRQQLLLLGYGINATQLKGGLYPTSGTKQYAKIEVGSDNVISDVSLAILRAGMSGLYSFGELSSHQLIGSIDAATIITNNFDNVPYNQRFFAGGDRSIRGYDYKSLSPTDNSGFLLGGQHLAVTSAEYNYLFSDNWRAAIFTDIGNSYENDFTSKTKVGAGIGIRWLSPVGLVRVDFAAGVSEKNPPMRIHFFIGPPL